jgi:DNA-directed RNA polymerase specialized sigma24 family protein
MVKLRADQQRGQVFQHDLLDSAPRPLKTVDSLVEQAIEGDAEARDTLIVGHLSMLRHTIGRYLYHWPITRRFKDDMVSAGLLAMTRVIKNLQPSTLAEQTLGQYLLNNICAAVEDEVARLRGICPRGPSTNRRYVQQGQDPFYGEVESSVVEDAKVYLETRFEEFDVLDVVARLKQEAGVCARLLDCDLWNLTDAEIAQQIGVSEKTVYRHRVKMLRRYFELTGDLNE